MQIFIEKYREFLFNTKGEINANLSRCKKIAEIEADARALTAHFPSFVTVKDRVKCIMRNVDVWPKCEVCDNPVKFTNNKFTTFCGAECSRTPGSSTFIKAQQTCLQKYGTKSNLVTKEALDFKRVNGGIGLANPKTANKVKTTNLIKYGCENVFSNDSVKAKIKNTHDIKYGGNFNTMKLGEKIKLLENYDFCKELATQHCMSSICEIIGVASNTVYKYFIKHGIANFNRQRSNQEVEFFDFLTKLGISDLVSGDRKIIAPYEIDVYIPSLKLGFELHGNYWHSEKAGCKSNYHAKKLKMAKHAGIKLVQIFESEWSLKTEIVKSRISSLVGKSIKIPARKCKVRICSSNQKKEFLVKNHIQGDCASSKNLGLFFEEELVAVMTFGKSRFDKKYDYELIRFCSKLNHTIIGGFSKLLKHFSQKSGISIISYSDNRWSTGNVYVKNGFELQGESAPAYFYFLKSSLILENRQKYQKHKLKDLLEVFDESKSEWENMKENGYNRIWDCGTTKWVLEINTLDPKDD